MTPVEAVLALLLLAVPVVAVETAVRSHRRIAGLRVDALGLRGINDTREELLRARKAAADRTLDAVEQAEDAVLAAAAHSAARPEAGATKVAGPAERAEPLAARLAGIDRDLARTLAAVEQRAAARERENARRTRVALRVETVVLSLALLTGAAASTLLVTAVLPH